MCLASVSSKKPKSTGTGWKTFQKIRGRRGRYRPSIMYVIGEYFLAGIWYRAMYTPKGLKKNPAGLDYSPGFHIFLNKKNAVAAVRTGEIVRKVSYRGAHTLGEGQRGYLGGPQVVANSIMIMPARSK